MCPASIEVGPDLSGRGVTTIEQAGFKGLKNGKLLEHASRLFDVLITVDKNIEHQQNTAELPMTVLILSAKSNRYEELSPLIPRTMEALESIKKGEILRIGN